MALPKIFIINYDTTKNHFVILLYTLFSLAMFDSRKMLRKGKKKIMWKIIFFSLDYMENMMEKKYKEKYDGTYHDIFPTIFLKK